MRMLHRFVLSAGIILLFGQPLLAQSKQTVQTILEKAPKRGICVVQGITDPKMLVELAKSSELTFYVQLADEKQVMAAREAADQAGLLGSRLYVAQSKGNSLGLASDLADAAFVVGDSPKDATVQNEILRVLHPGGVAYFGKEKQVKPFPKNTDDWSHPYHGPDNNPQSTDKVARGPFLTHFMAEPWYGAMPQMSVISGGRIIKVWGNRTSKQPQWDVMNIMMCMNAFNGTIQWTRKIKDGFMLHRNTLIATPDTIYFGDDTSCKLIDPATGKTLDEIIAPADLCDGPVWCWMALHKGVLYALIGKQEPQLEMVKVGPLRGAGWPWWKYKQYDFGFGRTILAIDPKTKKVLWHHREKEYLDMRAMCMTGDKIFFYSDQKFLGCLDAKSGKVLWKNSDADMLQAIAPHKPAQNPYEGYETTSYVKCSDEGLFFAGPTRKNLVGVSAKNGKLLWQYPDGNYQLVLRDRVVYALGGGRINEKISSYKLEPLTGKILATFASRDRCTRATGCLDAIFTRGGKGGGTAVFEITKGAPMMGLLSPMRPACQDGVTVAHGYLYWGPWMCRCDYTQIGVISLGPAGSFDFAAKAVEEDRLLTLAGKSQELEPLKVSKDDWPAFRKDNACSTHTNVAIPAKVKPHWTYTPAGKHTATAPITAGGLIFVSGSDGAVRALDASSGKPRWTAYTGGAVKYPPTVWENRVFVGSGDGWVYCLEAATGKTIWQFRAAPAERKIPVFGSLISTWPIGGGVIVEKGVVYAAAGNANFNGTYVYALDAKSGKIVWRNSSSGHLVEKNDSGAGVQGHLLLHGKKLYMPGGNLTGVVSYNLAGGKFQREGNGVGKDLYLLGDSVQASGLPLYFRPEDSHFIERAGLETSAGVVAVYEDRVGLVDPKSDVKGKLKAIWTAKPFQENNAVAVAKNTVLIAGLDRNEKDGKTTISAGLCAVNLTDGKILWQQALPAAPVGWGIAIDRNGQIMVSLRDGCVVCFGADN